MELIDLSSSETGAYESSAPDIHMTARTNLLPGNIHGNTRRGPDIDLSAACRQAETQQRSARAKYRRGQAHELSNQMCIISMAMQVLRAAVTNWDEAEVAMWVAMEDAFDKAELIIHAIEEVNAAQLSITEGRRAAVVSGS